MDTHAPRVDRPLAEAWRPPLPDAPGFEHVVVETPGVRRHVAVIGEGEPVVLLHGFPQHWWEWHAVAPVLAAHGYRVICPDLRGSGWTGADDPAIGRDTQPDDVLVVLDAFGIDRAHVMSHDMGAISAMRLAYGHPERVRAMVQLSVPPAFMEFTLAVVPAFRHMPKLLMHRPPTSMRYLFGPEYLFRPLGDEALAAYLDVEQRPEVLEAVRRVYRGMVVPMSVQLARGDFTRMRLRAPTLFAFGRHDRPFTEEIVRRISRHHERCADLVELAFVEDASHFVVDDAPDAVAELALDWFRRAA